MSCNVFTITILLFFLMLLFKATNNYHFGKSLDKTQTIQEKKHELNKKLFGAKPFLRQRVT